MTTAQAPTLTVLHEGMPIYTSHSTWLHPLFELEAYLADYPFEPAKLILQDKIIGKAAALLIHRSLNLSDFVVDESWAVWVGVRLKEPPYFRPMGVQTTHRYAAPQPVLTRYKLL